MTSQPPTTEELVKQWRDRAGDRRLGSGEIRNDVEAACDLIERLVKERDEAKAACEMYFSDADDSLSKAEVFAKVCDELDTKLRAMTARAEKAELFEKHVLASHLIPVSEAKNKQLVAEERAEAAEKERAELQILLTETKAGISNELFESVCEERDELEEKVEAAEAKLAVAVEALKMLAERGCYNCADDAIAALAKLEGK